MTGTDRQIDNPLKKNLHLELVGYALSGGLATASHWSVMALLMMAGMLPILATAIGALTGAVLNYLLQRNLTFQSAVTHRSALPRYFGVCILTWLMNLLLFTVLHRSLQMSSVGAQGLTTFLVAFMSYFLYKKVVFNDNASAPVFP